MEEKPIPRKTRVKTTFGPDEMKILFQLYRLRKISLCKLAELLECSIEEAKSQLKARNITLDLGVDSDCELLSDIENA